MKGRAVKLIKISAVLIIAGCVYLAFISLTGFGIPCVFNLVTGLDCPGCGVTRLVFALVRFDFKAAFEYNPVTFCFIPLFAYFFVRYAYQYIRFGKFDSTKAEKIIQIIMIAVYVLFGIVRNLPFYPYK